MIDLDECDPNHPSNATPDEMMSDYEAGSFDGYRECLRRIAPLVEIARAAKAVEAKFDEFIRAKSDFYRLAMERARLERECRALVRTHLLPAEGGEGKTT